MHGMIDMPNRTPARSQEEQAVLRRALATLAVFQTEVNEHMSLQLAHTFLMVSLSEGKSLREYSELAGVAQSSMSRRLLDLGQKNRNNEPGHLLIERQQDPMELRKNIYTLSPKGRRLVAKIVGALKGKTPEGTSDDTWEAE